jgi:hypothetical protein
MTSIRCSALLFILAAASVSASAQRIKRPPPDEAQLARIAVEDAMTDGSLQTGDIIVTTKGFVRFLGMKPDGSLDFAVVDDPLTQEKHREHRARRPK